MKYALHSGDCRDVLKTLAENSIDAIVTDPPYHLTSIVRRFGSESAAPAKFGTDGVFQRSSRGFMGKTWDGGDVAFQAETWTEVLRVAKPGAMLLAFGGTRTYHRLACAIEDAGWDVRDCLMWLYGTGFPKSHDISKQIDKTAGAERAVVGQRSVTRDFTDISGGRYGDKTVQSKQSSVAITVPATDLAREWDGWGTALKPAWEPILLAMKPCDGSFAHNAETWGVAGLNIDDCRLPTHGKKWKAPRGGIWRTDSDAKAGITDNPKGRWPANVLLDDDAAAMLEGCGASRFFYCPKASPAERGESNTHPTVKPLKLMRWLITLVTRPEHIVLDPFMGSGSTGVAAVHLGRAFVGVELEESSLETARVRIEKALSAEGLFAS